METSKFIVKERGGNRARGKERERHTGSRREGGDRQTDRGRGTERQGQREAREGQWQRFDLTRNPRRSECRTRTSLAEASLLQPPVSRNPGAEDGLHQLETGREGKSPTSDRHAAFHLRQPHVLSLCSEGSSAIGAPGRSARC